MDLTEEQKALILENKGVISDLTELTNMVFPGEGNLDGRTKEGRAVRAFKGGYGQFPNCVYTISRCSCKKRRKGVYDCP